MNYSAIQSIRKFVFEIPLFRLSFLLFIGLSVLCNISIMAQGNLLIAPLRVVFEGQKRVAEINLANTGQDSAKYSVSFLQYRMTEDGSYEELTTPDPGQQFCDKHIRVFPRLVMLGPNETQVVKLQLTKKEELQTGEYRSHLYFRALPNQSALGETSVIKDSSAISLKIVPIFGITIPVIIRVGESTTSINITDLKIEKTSDGTNRLFLSIQRTGNMSVYGDISILYIAPDAKETLIGLQNGVAVYTPNALRKLQVILENKSSVDLKKGKIRVSFSSQSDIRPEKFSETELVL